MDEDAFYEKSMEDIRGLVSNVMQQCEEFADAYYYEREWVLDRFREEFNKAKRNF